MRQSTGDMSRTKWVVEILKWKVTVWCYADLQLMLSASFYVCSGTNLPINYFVSEVTYLIRDDIRGHTLH